MKKFLTAAAALAAVASLTACGTSTGTASDKPASGTNAPTSSAPPTDTDTAATADDPSSSNDTPAKFGQTYTWEDGLSVKVSKPVKFKPSQYAAGTDGKGTPIRVTITIVNKTGKTYDPAAFNATMQSGDTEASGIFDEGLTGSPTTKLLNGRQATFPQAWKAADPADLVLEVSPGFEYNGALFATK